MIIDLELRDPSRVIESVPAPGAWDATGNADAVAGWLGNAYDTDRAACRLAARQAAADGRALRISFPSVMTFIMGYDFEAGAFGIYVPADHGAEGE
jgi:hypothetical protein